MLYLCSIAALSVTKELGKLGKLHLIDLSSNAKSESIASAKKQIQLAVYLEKKLAKFEESLKYHELPLPDPTVIPREMKESDTLSALMKVFTNLEKEYTRQMLIRIESIKIYQDNLLQQQVLELHREYMPFDVSAYESPFSSPSKPAQYGAVSDSVVNPLAATEPENNSFNYTQPVSGVVPRAMRVTFERMLFRLGRGNITTIFMPIDLELKEESGNEAAPAVTFDAFLMLHVQSEDLKRKVDTACKLFNCRTYDLPTTPRAYNTALTAIIDRLRALRTTLDNTDELIQVR